MIFLLFCDASAVAFRCSGTRTSPPHALCSFQCGYEDVGYTPPISASERAFVDSGYPFNLSDFALTDPVTVPKEELECVDGAYGSP